MRDGAGNWFARWQRIIRFSLAQRGLESIKVHNGSLVAIASFSRPQRPPHSLPVSSWLKCAASAPSKVCNCQPLTVGNEWLRRLIWFCCHCTGIRRWQFSGSFALPSIELTVGKGSLARGSVGLAACAFVAIAPVMQASLACWVKRRDSRGAFRACVHTMMRLLCFLLRIRLLHRTLKPLAVLAVGAVEADLAQFTDSEMMVSPLPLLTSPLNLFPCPAAWLNASSRRYHLECCKGGDGSSKSDKRSDRPRGRF